MFKKGNRKFDNCQAKVVEFVTWGYPSGTQTYKQKMVAPKDGNFKQLKKVGNDNEEGRIYGGSEAKLHCPVVDADDRRVSTSAHNNHNGQDEALKSLRKEVSTLLCKNCIFSDMSPLQVAEERARLAKAETVLLDAERHRTEALAALIEIDPTYRVLE